MNDMINKEQKIRLVKNTAIISGIMTFIVSLLLLLNYYQLSTHDPTESKTMEALVHRLADEPNNEELIEEIRNYDLLARKAYFNAQWQVNTGGYLLLAFAVILVLSLRMYYSLTARIEQPQEQPGNENLRKLLAQKWIIGAGMLFIGLSLIAAILSNKHYVSYSAQNLSSVNESTPAEEQVEVVDVVDKEEGTEQVASEQNKEGAAGDTTGKAEEEPPRDTSNEQIAAERQGEEVREVQEEQEKTFADFPTMQEIKNNHNAFRGPLGNGISYQNNIPTQWDGPSDKNIIWKKKMVKPGYNSPVIWDDKLFISGADKESRMVFCYNRKTGELLWQGKADNIPGSPSEMPKTTDDTGLAAPTVTTDGRRVYAIFATGDVIAFNMNGKRLWAKNLGVPDNHYGHSSSLISWKEKLFIQYDTNEGGKIITLNVFNGDIIWQKNRDSRISWASPILAPVDGELQLVLSGVPIVAGYNLENGNEIWSVDCMMGEVGPSPAYSDGNIFAANEYARLVAINSDNDYQIDWEKSEYLPEVASPVVSDNLLFLATSYGVVVCYDATTGEKYWEMECDNGFYSSPVVADGKVYVIDMSGTTHIMEVSKELKLVGEPELGEKAFATPAFDQNRIYIRGSEYLYCIGE
jgi:outer membrane protein assembly factor BamB